MSFGLFLERMGAFGRLGMHGRLGKHNPLWHVCKVWYGMVWYVCKHNNTKQDFSRDQNGRSVPYLVLLVALSI